MCIDGQYAPADSEFEKPVAQLPSRRRRSVRLLSIAELTTVVHRSNGVIPMYVGETQNASVVGCMQADD